MAVQYQANTNKVLTAGNSSTSESFTPTPGNFIFAYGNSYPLDNPPTITGSVGSYTLLSPPGNADDTHGDYQLIAYKASTAGGAQTATCATSADTGGGDEVWIATAEYSGVLSIGSGSMAIRDGIGADTTYYGTAITVPIGSTLIAISARISAGGGTISAINGTPRSLGALNLLMSEFVGDGSSVTPAFQNTAASNFSVFQFLLTGDATAIGSAYQSRRNRPGRGPLSVGRYARRSTQNIGDSNGEWPFTESVLPNAVTLTNMSGAYTDIDDSPDSPDGSWLTWVH